MGKASKGLGIAKKVGKALDADDAARKIELQEYMRDSLKRADEQGYGPDLYHGSTHDIKEFGGNTANPGGHFGSTNYLTTSADDASRHYAGEGPDLTQRIQLRAEQIAGDMDVDYDDPTALAKARLELKGENQGVIYPVRTRAKNTYDVSADGDTFMEYNQPTMDAADYIDEAAYDVTEADFDSLDEYKEALQEKAEELALDDSYNFEPEGSLVDFMDSIRNNPSVDDSAEILTAIQEEAYGGGISAGRLDEIMRNTEWWSEGDAGELFNNEVYRRAVEDAGFDSILHDADIFPGMDVEAGTKHMLVFDPAKIRSVNAAFDPAKAGRSDMLGAASPEILASLAATSAAASFYERRNAKKGFWNARRQELVSFFGGMAEENTIATLGAGLVAQLPWQDLDKPMQGVYGLGATGMGLAQGQGLDQSLQMGANIAQQPVEDTAYQAGGYVTDVTGSPLAGQAVNVLGQVMGPI